MNGRRKFLYTPYKSFTRLKNGRLFGKTLIPLADFN